MDYYLLSEQDLDELVWEIENFLFELRSKIESKKVKEDPQSTDDNEPLESSEDVS